MKTCKIFGGKILSGEVKTPKSYSLRTLDLLRNLSTEDAEIFIKFGSHAIVASDLTFVLNTTIENSFSPEFGFTINERLLLEELGLLTANDLQYEISATTKLSSTIFQIGNTLVIQQKLPNKPAQALPILVFTKTGKELLKLIEKNPSLEYLQLLATKLDRSNGAVKYANIVERLPNDMVRHSPLVDIPLNNK